MLYTFNIESLKKKTINGIDDVIFDILWEKIGYDEDGNEGKFKTSTRLDTSKVDESELFIEYQNLSKQDVVNWIKNSIDEDFVNSIIQEEIQRILDNEISVSFKDMPWNINQEENR